MFELHPPPKKCKEDLLRVESWRKAISLCTLFPLHPTICHQNKYMSGIISWNNFPHSTTYCLAYYRLKSVLLFEYCWWHTLHTHPWTWERFMVTYNFFFCMDNIWLIWWSRNLIKRSHFCNPHMTALYVCWLYVARFILFAYWGIWKRTRQTKKLLKRAHRDIENYFNWVIPLAPLAKSYLLRWTEDLFLSRGFPNWLCQKLDWKPCTHKHPLYTEVFSSKNQLILPITVSHIMVFGEVSVCWVDLATVLGNHALWLSMMHESLEVNEKWASNPCLSDAWVYPIKQESFHSFKFKKDPGYLQYNLSDI